MTTTSEIVAGKVCPDCNSTNTERLIDGSWECWDCGRPFPIPNVKHPKKFSEIWYEERDCRWKMRGYIATKPEEVQFT